MSSQFGVEVLGYNEKQEVVLKVAVPRRFVSDLCKGLRDMPGSAWGRMADEVHSSVVGYEETLQQTWTLNSLGPRVAL
jgi:hypothetical protein